MNEKLIRNIIKKESLRIIKESQASFLIEASSEVKHSMEDVNAMIDLYEKKLDKLNNEEKSAISKEDYLELKDIKVAQLDALNKMINGYKTKLSLLESQKEDLENEIQNVENTGEDVFKNQEMNEFSNDSFEKGWGLKIKLQNHFLDLVKIGDHNAYKVINTDITGLIPGSDLLQMPNLKIGGGGNISLYRKTGERYEKIKDFEVSNVKDIIKNPK